MIKVLHVFGKMNRGGAEMRTLELMPQLFTKGVHSDFCVLSGGEGDLDGQIRQLGGNVYVCSLLNNRLTFGRRFVNFLRKSDYDIVHSHADRNSGNIVRLAYKAGIKARIVHCRNTNSVSISWLKNMYYAILRWMAGRYATAVLAVSRSAMESYWGENWQSDSRCRVIYNGLDLSPFKKLLVDKQSLFAEIGIPADSKIVINVARFHNQKNHKLLLEAFAMVAKKDSRIHLLLVGDGPLQENMRIKAMRLNIDNKVYFIGKREDVPRLLKASDCFVLSSLWEGLPGVVLEAVAARLPVVATELPGVEEIAAYTNLIHTVAINDPLALCQKILDVIKKGKPRVTKPFPSEFSLSRCADKLYEVYVNQLGQHSE